MSVQEPQQKAPRNPVARPEERRADIIFRDKDRALSRDVHELGIIVGEMLREQCGEALYNAVEAARRSAIDRREGDESAGVHLDGLVRSLSTGSARDFVRAFSTYFQVVNTAEQVHRIRRRRAYLRDSTNPQPGSLEETAQLLKDEGVSLDQVMETLGTLSIEPVFTAHPTEPTRRTILRKQQHIVRHVLDMHSPTLTPQDKQASHETVRADITSIWQTEENPSRAMTVSDHLEHVLFYFTDVIYRAIPYFYESLQTALADAWGKAGERAQVPPIVHFASWVGGDMDKNPDVTARVIRETLSRQRSLILDLYYRECQELANRLSQSSTRVNCSSELHERIHAYTGHFPAARSGISQRHRDMPYRVFLRLIMARLQATFDDGPYPYESANELIADIRLIASSLREHKGIHAGLFSVQRLIRRIETFGFRFLTLDIRENAMAHMDVIGRCLGEEDWLEKERDYRAARIRQALETNESPIRNLDNRSKRSLAVFEAIAYCRRKFGQASIGPFVISMSHGVEDVLAVLLLARWADLRQDDGSVPLDIAPVFQTVEDLEEAPHIMMELVRDPLYRDHLNHSGGAEGRPKQVVMVGYTDSSRDAGMASSRWAVQRAQRRLVDVMEETGVQLILFHGRGGTVSRGGGKTHAAVLGSPSRAIQGHLRATEQGELVNAKYGVRAMAVRTLEQSVSAVALATVRSEREDARVNPDWRAVMREIAYTSRSGYQELVYGREDFLNYFNAGTPVDVIQRMQSHGEPELREHEDVNSLRSVAWAFSWSQGRYFLPEWYGLGTALQKALDEHGESVLMRMVKEWKFFAALLADAEMGLAKSDLTIAARYSELAGDLHQEIFPLIRAEFDTAVNCLLQVKEQEVLLEKNDTLRRSIRLRNPYVDPMSLLQVDLLRRWRASGRQDEGLFTALIASVNGIARGLQDSG